jgi:hypothetical protein
VKGGIGEDVVVGAAFVVVEALAEGIELVDLGRFQIVEDEVHPGDADHGAVVVVAVEEAVEIGCLPSGQTGRTSCGVPSHSRRSTSRGRCVGLPMQEGIEQEAAGAAGGIEDLLAKLRLEQLDHEADDVARGAELPVLAGLLHLFEQILEDVAHDVGIDRAGVELAEEFVDEADGALEGLGLVDIEDEVGVAEAAGDAAEGGVAVLRRADPLLQSAEPGKDGVVEQREKWVLADVGPAAFLEKLNPLHPWNSLPRSNVSHPAFAVADR